MSRAAILSALLLAGCASSAQPDVVQAIYRCERHVIVPARFDNTAQVVDLTLAPGQIVRLVQQPSGSGIGYAADGYELRGKGRQATITLPGQAPLTCYSLAGP